MMKQLEHRGARNLQMGCERIQLRAELCEARKKLAWVDSCFDMVEDHALLDSLIYQRSELMAHYSYLLRKAKALEAGVCFGDNIGLVPSTVQP